MKHYMTQLKLCSVSCHLWEEKKIVIVLLELYLNLGHLQHLTLQVKLLFVFVFINHGDPKTREPHVVLHRDLWLK